MVGKDTYVSCLQKPWHVHHCCWLKTLGHQVTLKLKGVSASHAGNMCNVAMCECMASWAQFAQRQKVLAEFQPTFWFGTRELHNVARFTREMQGSALCLCDLGCKRSHICRPSIISHWVFCRVPETHSHVVACSWREQSQKRTWQHVRTGQVVVLSDSWIRNCTVSFIHFSWQKHNKQHILYIFAFAFAGWHVDQDKREVSGAVQLVDRPGRSTGGPSICALVKDWRGPSMRKPPPQQGETAGKEAYRTHTTLK